MPRYLRIGYINANGFSASAALWLTANIGSGQGLAFDLFFVAETHFQDIGGMLKRHRHFLGHTEPSPGSVGAQRFRHGLALFGTHEMRNWLKLEMPLPFTILATAGSFSFAGFYLPPSLPDSAISAHLPSVPLQFFIGDINVHYGAAFGDHNNGNQQASRRAFIDALMEENHLVHLSSSGVNARTDHAFAHPDCVPVLVYRPSPGDFDTNHECLLDLTILHPSAVAASELLPLPRRIRLNPLISTPVLCSNIFKASFHPSAQMMELAVIRLVYVEATDPIDARQLAIDAANTLFMAAIEVPAELLLRTYSPAVIDDLPLEPLHFAVNAVQASESGGDDRGAVAFEDEAHALYRRATQSQSIFSYTGMTSRDPARTVEEDVLDYYCSVFGPPPAECSEFGMDLARDSAFEDLYGHIFSEASVKEAIEGMPSCKSGGGHDFVHTRLLKCLMDTVLPKWLAAFFNHCCRLAVTPSAWNVARVSLIPKVKGASTVDQFRPIALTTVLRRVFELHLLSQLTRKSFGGQKNISQQLHKTQAAFRTGYSTDTHALVSEDLFRQGFNSRVFIDFKQAYDRVVFAVLLKKLQGMGVPRQLLLLIQALFTKTQVDFCINGRLSSRIDCQRGILQGTHLSPLLFNVYINDLALELSKRKIRKVPAVLLYADDVQIIPHSARHLTWLLSVLDKWCVSNGMVVNIGKCGGFGPIFADSGLRFSIQGQDILTVACYNYLGLPTTVAGIDWEQYLTMVHANGTRMLNILMSKCQNADIPVRLALYKSYVRPCWEFALPLFWYSVDQERAMELLRPLEELQQDALKWILMARRLLVVHSAITCLAPVVDRVQDLCAGLCHRLRGLPAKHLVNILRRGLTVPLDITSRVWSDPRWLEWHRDKTTNVSLKAYLRDGLIKRFNNSGSLCLAILPEARKAGSGIDVSLTLPFHKDPGHWLVHWRLNRLSLGQQCRCEHVFNKAHVDSCFGGLLKAYSGIQSRSEHHMDAIVSICPEEAIVILHQITDILKAIEEGTFTE